MKKILLLTIFVLLGTIPIWSLPYKINYLTADDGLSRNLVTQIFRDSHGFMWIATSNGLDRYDGYDFIHFNSRNSGNALQSDNVHCVEEDINGNLWIGTENGLNFFNYQTGKIVSANAMLDTKLNLNSSTISIIKKDEVGDIWIVYDKGLARLHYDSNNNIQTEFYTYSRHCQ